jgi:hypothetical protein
VINLVTSQANGCRYCQAAHTVLGKMNGFSYYIHRLTGFAIDFPLAVELDTVPA